MVCSIAMPAALVMGISRERREYAKPGVARDTNEKGREPFPTYVVYPFPGDAVEKSGSRVNVEDRLVAPHFDRLLGPAASDHTTASLARSNSWRAISVQDDAFPRFRPETDVAGNQRRRWLGEQSSSARPVLGCSQAMAPRPAVAPRAESHWRSRDVEPARPGSRLKSFIDTDSIRGARSWPGRLPRYSWAERS